MEVSVCKHCRRLFRSPLGGNACPACSVELEALFKMVKRYIRSHPDATIVEVSGACEVDIEQLKYWIKDERIEYTKSSAIGIECERCGVSIKTGRLCFGCKQETINTLKSVYVKKEVVETETEKPTHARMRFLNGNNIKKP